MRNIKCVVSPRKSNAGLKKILEQLIRCPCQMSHADPTQHVILLETTYSTKLTKPERSIQIDKLQVSKIHKLIDGDTMTLLKGRIRSHDELNNYGDDTHQDEGEVIGRQIRKWVRLLTPETASTPLLSGKPIAQGLDFASRTEHESSTSLPETELGHSALGSGTPSQPLKSRKQSHSQVHICLIPGCSFRGRSLAKVEAHIRKTHFYQCHATLRTGSNTINRSVQISARKRFCGLVFPSSHILDLHSEEAHSPFFWARLDRGDAVFQCPVPTCSKRFSTTEERKIHVVMEEHGWDADMFDSLFSKISTGASNYSRNVTPSQMLPKSDSQPRLVSPEELCEQLCEVQMMEP
jgi:hypothetical protein